MYDAIWHMRSRRVRRLPVVEARGFLVGILTVDDVTEFLAEELTQMTRVALSSNARKDGSLPRRLLSCSMRSGAMKRTGPRSSVAEGMNALRGRARPVHVSAAVAARQSPP